MQAEFTIPGEPFGKQRPRHSRASGTNACDDAQFVVRFIGGDVESFDNLYSGDCEVIGNIYDNPELLEVSGND